MKTLCWFYLGLGRMEAFSIPSDLNRFIAEKFTAHGKKFSGEKEKKKAVNTAKLFTDWQAASHSQYQISHLSPLQESFINSCKGASRSGCTDTGRGVVVYSFNSR